MLKENHSFLSNSRDPTMMTQATAFKLVFTSLVSLLDQSTQFGNQSACLKGVMTFFQIAWSKRDFVLQSVLLFKQTQQEKN